MSPLRRAAPTLAAALSLSLLGVAACSRGSNKLIPLPPTTVGRVTTAPAGTDYTGISLAPVEGRPPAVAAVKVAGGDAVLSGTVLGPEGPVGGATVRIERLVGDAIGRLDIISNPDGTWKAPEVGPPVTVPAFPSQTVPGDTVPGQFTTTALTLPTTTTTVRPGPLGILGGRYRVRAWRAPDLALTTPQILFLEAKQNLPLPIQLSRYTGVSVTSVAVPDPPVLNGALNLTATVTTGSVDADGVVRSQPAPGATVSLGLGSGLLLVNGPPLTNAQGKATFQLRCVALGVSAVELTVNGTQTFSLPLRPCVAPATTTTAATLPFDPTGSSSTLFGAGSTTPTRTPTTT